MNISENHPPSITVRDEPSVGVKVPFMFEVAASDPDSSDSLLFTWYWGDGTLSVTSAQMAVHAYDYQGVYNLTVWADDQTGLVGHNVSDVGFVLVVGCAHTPIVTDFHASNTMPSVGEVVIFYGTAIDLYDDLLFYSWDFGDGETNTSSGIPSNYTATVMHVYNSTGSFNASLVVSDGQTATPPAELTIEVQLNDIVPPVAVARVGPNPAMAGEVVTFNASESFDGVGIVNYMWTFLDGSIPVILYGEVVSYVFISEPQTVAIVLNVSDAEGNWDNDSVWLDVAGIIPELPGAVGPVAAMLLLVLTVVSSAKKRRKNDRLE
jgi:PKD repeat protein